MCSDINCWGFRLPHARTGGVLIVAQKEAKHTETQYLTWFGKTAYIHGRESILLEIRERIQNKYMEEEDHFTHTQLPAFFAALAAAAIAALSFSLLSSHSHNPLLILLSKIMPLL